MKSIVAFGAHPDDIAIGVGYHPVKYMGTCNLGSGKFVFSVAIMILFAPTMKWDGLWCPCCGYRLRTRPRNLKYKAKLQGQVNAAARATRLYKFIKNSFHTNSTVEYRKPGSPT